MHDAAVAGMLCARRYGAITQGWFGVGDRAGDEEFPARRRIISRPLVTSRPVSPVGTP